MLETFNLTSLGAIHTALALVAVVAGIIALFRAGAIDMTTRSGQVFVWFTVATSVTGLFIFRHGGFGPPHVLSILTLVVLAAAYVAEKVGRPGGFGRYVTVTGNSLALFFHLLPGLNEGGTRLPLGDPVFSGPDDPTLKALVGAGFLVYLIGAGIQVARIRRSRRALPAFT
jgi:uncharacterized membrane protein